MVHINEGNLRLVLDMRVPNQALAVYKSGTGTRGQGHRDACVGTWDVKYREAGDAGCE